MIHNRAAIIRAQGRDFARRKRASRTVKGLCIICPSPARPARPGLKTCGKCNQHRRPPGQRRGDRLSDLERDGIRRDYTRRSALLDQAFDLRQQAKALDREAAAFTLLALAKKHKCHVATVRRIVDEK